MGENVESPTNQDDLSSEWIDQMRYIINNTIVYVRTFPTDTNQI